MKYFVAKFYGRGAFFRVYNNERYFKPSSSRGRVYCEIDDYEFAKQQAKQANKECRDKQIPPIKKVAAEQLNIFVEPFINQGPKAPKHTECETSHFE